jgi:hypothetical protein
MTKIAETSSRPIIKTVLLEGPKAMVAASAEALSKTAEVAASAIDVASKFTSISTGVSNLQTWSTNTAMGIGALGFVGAIYEFTDNFSSKTPAFKAKTILYGGAAVIDVYMFLGALKLIPVKAIASAIRSIPVIGAVANAIGLGVFQSVLVVAASACNITEQVRLLKNSKNTIRKSATTINKWVLQKGLIENAKTTDSALANQLLEKYRGKFTQLAKKTPEERKAQETRWTTYIKDLEKGSFKSVEENNDYKIKKWEIEKINARSQIKRSIFAIIADVCKVALIIFATIMSFVFPVASLAIGAVIAIATLINHSVSLTNILQEALFHKMKKLPKRPVLEAA